MSSGIFRISVNTVPAFFRRSSSFSLSSAQLVIASNNALIAQTNILFFMTVSSNGYSCGNLCFGWRVSCDIISPDDDTVLPYARPFKFSPQKLGIKPEDDKTYLDHRSPDIVLHSKYHSLVASIQPDRHSAIRKASIATHPRTFRTE